MHNFISILRPLGRPIAGVLRDRRGATAILMAVALSGIVGFAGLGSEAAAWYYTTRSMQGATDASAATAAAQLAAAKKVGGTVSCTQLRNEARSIAATYNYTNGTANTTVSINGYDTAGTSCGALSNTTDLSTCSSPFSSLYCYIEVILTQQQTPLLSAVIMGTSWQPTITTRSVAVANTEVTVDACVVALDKVSGDTGIQMSGNPSMNFSGCSLYDNSGLATGGGTINAKAAYVVGSISGSGLTTTDGTYSGNNPLPDPYSNIAIPSYTHGHCDEGNASNGTKLTGNKQKIYAASGSTPYVFCQGLEVQGGSTAIFCPGTYIMDRGVLDLRGGGVLLAPPTATTNPSVSIACPLNLTGGVTIILTNSTGVVPPASISIGANSTFSMTAPTSGSLAGMALFQDRITCTSNNCGDSLGGGSTQNITGIMYFPNNIVSYSGGASTGGAVCTKLVAYRITFNGNSNFSSSCTSAGTGTINNTNGTLVM